MSLDAWLTVGMTVLVLIVLAKEWAPADVVFVAAVVVLALFGVITPKDAFEGCISPGVLMVGALFIAAAALRETGAIDYLGQRLLGGIKTEFSMFMCLAGVTLTTSAFINNTPVVAMLLPLVMSWCRKHQVSPSKLLIPLSFMTILGGTCTLIGTSTNLVVQGLLEKKGLEVQALWAKKGLEMPPGLLENLGLEKMSFFEIGWAGVPCAIIGTIYMLTVGRKLLPERKEMLDQLEDSRREYLVEMLVQPTCRLIGQSVEAAGLRRLPGLFLIEIDRRGSIIGPVAPDEVLEAEDRLVFTGIVSTIVDLKKIPGLVPAEDATYDISAQQRRGRRMCEAVVSRSSPLVGQKVRDSGFRAQYQAAIVAIHRNGERLLQKIGDVELQAGDTLLLQTGTSFVKAHRNNPDFYLVSDVDDSQAVRHEQQWLSIGLFLATVAAVSTEIINPMLAAFIGAGLMIVTRCISLHDARQAIEWPTLISIGASFGLGTALEKSGAAKYVATMLVDGTQPFGPWATLAAIYLATMVLNELITNNGAAALAIPFAIEAAEIMGVSPRPFIIAVTLAASFAFASPIGYQTHMMVYGPGGYRFSDFVKVGVPLNVLLWIVAMCVIPIFWPFVAVVP